MYTTHTHTHTHTHTYSLTHSLTHTHTRTHAYSHTHTHTHLYTHTHSHTFVHTHTFTYTDSCNPLLPSHLLSQSLHPHPPIITSQPVKTIAATTTTKSGTTSNACERVRVAQSRQKERERFQEQFWTVRENRIVGCEQGGCSRQGNNKLQLDRKMLGTIIWLELEKRIHLSSSRWVYGGIGRENPPI